jgi:hypothetical protein
MAKRLIRIPFADLLSRASEWKMRSGSLVFNTGVVLPLQFEKVESNALLCHEPNGKRRVIAFSDIQEIIIDHVSAD